MWVIKISSTWIQSWDFKCIFSVSLGEKLDYKACESLEEILKRVQFKVIDLEQTNLDEDVWKSFYFFFF